MAENNITVSDYLIGLINVAKPYIYSNENYNLDKVKYLDRVIEMWDYKHHYDPDIIKEIMTDYPVILAICLVEKGKYVEYYTREPDYPGFCHHEYQYYPSIFSHGADSGENWKIVWNDNKKAENGLEIDDNEDDTCEELRFILGGAVRRFGTLESYYKEHTSNKVKPVGLFMYDDGELKINFSLYR